MAMQSRKTAPVDQPGHTLFWREAGPRDAPALVLLHGIGSDAQLWEAAATHWASHRRVLAWNAPGYGDSAPLDPMAEPGDPSSWAARLAEGLALLGVEKCDLVGHSLGALTAARFAATRPGFVRRLILSSPASGYALSENAPLSPALRARVNDMLNLGPLGMAQSRAPRTLAPGASDEMLAQAVAAMARVSPSGYCDAVQLLARGDLSSELQGWRGPLHLIAAAGDVIVPPGNVRALAEKRSDATLHVIDGAGHASYLQAPQAFAEIVNTLLEA